MSIAVPPTGIILPPGVRMPAPIEPLEAPEEAETVEMKATYLPKPTGYNILCALPAMSDTHGETGIVRAPGHSQREELATVVLFVVSMGDMAYSSKERYPNGPWCKVGDFVLVRQYSGTRFKVFGREMRILTDDLIQAVVSDPRGIAFAGA